jgi:hypothetical protein
MKTGRKNFPYSPFMQTIFVQLFCWLVGGNSFQIYIMDPDPN